MRKIIYSIFAFLGAMVLPALAMAEEAAAGTANSGAAGYIAIAVGLCMGAAVLGGALGQGKAAAAALEGIGRNPGAKSSIQAPMIICLAMMESLVLFSLLIAFMLLGKI